MKECFWNIKLLGCYIQLGKDYKLVIIKKNKEGQWVNKIKINFLPLLKKSPYRCNKCGTPYVNASQDPDGYGNYYCSKCDPDVEKYN